MNQSPCSYLHLNKKKIVLLVVMAVSGNSLGECMNMHGASFEPGSFYVPGPDLCRMCVCDNGHPKGCKSVSFHIERIFHLQFY